MLPAQPSCCRAVKRKLQAPTDAIWITDTTLAWAFNRLCIVSRPSRRNGTSVPGPLEARRRAGKRRMHYAEVARPPPPDLGARGGFLFGRQKDLTKWKWEAPVAPSAPILEQRAPELPTWLTQFEAPEVMEADVDALGQSDPLRHVMGFCESLRQVAKMNALRDLCSDFNQRFSQSIKLGEVSSDVLRLSIRDVPNYIRQRAKDSETANELCLQFLRALWSGIAGSAVLRPADLSVDFLQMLLVRLQQLPLQACAPLFSDVLKTINTGQTGKLKHEVFSSVNKALCSSLNDAVVARADDTGAASSRHGELLNVDALEKFVESLAAAVSTFATPKAPEQVRDLTRMATSYVAMSMHRHRASVLERPKNTCESVDLLWNCLRNVRTRWLKLVARLPYTSESLLVDACRMMEAGNPSSDCPVLAHLSMHDLSGIVLEFWKRQGRDECMPQVLKTFDDTASKRGGRAIVGFGMALQLHSPRWESHIGDFFRILRGIRGPSLATYDCMRLLEGAKIYLPSSTLRTEIYELAKIDISHARMLVKKYAERPENHALSLEEFPKLVMSMIRDPACHPQEIWEHFGGYGGTKRYNISESRIRLVRDMALEFAKTEHISTRVALRNVTKCYRYLSHHRVPIPADISRMITKVGLERKVLERGGIPAAELNWVLNVVEKVEGQRKASIMSEVLSRRAELEVHRNRDVLRRGPIN